MKPHVALFHLQRQVYALAVEEILIILQEPKVFALPLLSPDLAGMLIHDGEAIPLLKPERFLAEPVDDHCGYSYVVVCSTESGVVGLPTDKILHIVDRQKGRLEEGGQGSAAGEDPGSIFIYDQVRYLLLDIGRIVAELSLWDFRHPPPQGN